MSVTLIGPEGQKVEAEPEQVTALTDRGYRVLDADARAAAFAEEAREEYYTTPGQKIRAGAAGVARALSFGASDVVGRAMGGAEDLAALRDYNAGISTVTEIGGSLLTGKAIGGLGSKAAEGASTLAKIGHATKGAAAEGALFGAGSGVTEVALSKDPLTIDSAVATIGSHALFGGAVGGFVGGAAKATGIGLRKAKSALDDIATRTAAPVDDVAKKAFVDDVTAFRQQTIKDEVYAATRGAEEREIRTIAKIHVEADKAIDRALRNPKALVGDPKRILPALQQQEHALEQVVAKADDLRVKLQTEVDTFAMSSQGQKAAKKLAALDKVLPALEQNRALQARIAELTPAKAAAAGAAQGIAGNMLGGTAFSTAAGVVGAIPVVGPLLAPFAGSIASKFVTEGIGKALTAQAARTSKAIGTILAVGGKVAPVAPVLASKTLAAIQYAEKSEAPQEPKKAKTKKADEAPRLADSYKARTRELMSQTMYDPTGRVVMRPEARARMADQLSGLRAGDPIAADRMETGLARRYEFLASMIPRRPDVTALHVGPDTWQPSEMEMRAWARVAHAVEDPIGVVERVGAGMVTPEEAHAFRTVYPEMFADIVQQVWAQLPTLQKTLPYQKRLALTIFSGIPVDPALDPQILSVLQAQYATEPGTEGGTQAPIPQAQFGSVRAETGTPAQSREQGAQV